MHPRRRLTEFELPWLPGDESSKPVRAGNAASEQFQLDVYGETINAIHHAYELGLPPRPEAFRAWREFIHYVCDVWQRPDDGIWEVRGGRKHFTYSKVMAWVAVDRSVDLLERFADPQSKDMIPGMRALRERNHEDVCQRGFHPSVNAFTQYYGGDTLDASVLRIPWVGFLPATDPRMKGTVAAVEKTLLRDGFVQRYSTEHGVDGLAGSEGAFLACSFWLVDKYALAGRIDDAEKLMERLLALRTPLGLLSEEYDPSRRRLIGNFPHLLGERAELSAKRRQGACEGTRGAAAGDGRGDASLKGETAGSTAPDRRSIDRVSLSIESSAALDPGGPSLSHAPAHVRSGVQDACASRGASGRLYGRPRS